MSYIKDIDETIRTYRNEVNALKKGILKLSNWNNSNKYTNYKNYNYDNNNFLNHEKYISNYDTVESSYIQEPSIIEKENCKLQNEITTLKNQNMKLKDTIKLQEKNMNILTKKISSLQFQINKKRNNMTDFKVIKHNIFNENLKNNNKVNKSINDFIDYKNQNNKINLIEKGDIEKIKEEYEKKKNELEMKLMDKNNQINLIKEKYENELNNKENKIKVLIEKFKNELNEKDKVIYLLNQKFENEKNNKNNEFELKNKRYEKELKEKENEIKYIKRNIENEQKIISNFFTFYNQNLGLINELNFLDFIAKRYEFNIYNDQLNEQYSMNIINIFNKFISKIMLDNKEMYEVIIKTKNIIDEKDLLLTKQKVEIYQLQQLKKENQYLNQEINLLMKELSKKNNQQEKTYLPLNNNYFSNSTNYNYNPINTYPNYNKPYI